MDAMMEANATMEATVGIKKCHPSREILRVRRECPGCGIYMSYHALSYKHKCKGSPEAKRKRRLQQLDVRIEQRLGACRRLEQHDGVEDLEQRAQGEAVALGEDVVGLATVAHG